MQKVFRGQKERFDQAYNGQVGHLVGEALPGASPVPDAPAKRTVAELLHEEHQA